MVEPKHRFEAARGDLRGAEELMPLVYAELRQLAAARLAHEGPGQSLDATALVHEAYLRLVGARGASKDFDPSLASAAGSLEFANTSHFFAAAAEAMRRILVDRARTRRAEKHGGGFARQAVEMDDLAASASSPDLLALDEALDKLGAAAPRAAEVVKLRYFAGLTVPQAAAALGIAPRTADIDWAYAKAWLLAELRGDRDS